MAVKANDNKLFKQKVSNKTMRLYLKEISKLNTISPEEEKILAKEFKKEMKKHCGDWSKPIFVL